jgi:hypothetical protein
MWAWLARSTRRAWAGANAGGCCIRRRDVGAQDLIFLTLMLLLSLYGQQVLKETIEKNDVFHSPPIYLFALF